MFYSFALLGLGGGRYWQSAAVSLKPGSFGTEGRTCVGRVFSLVWDVYPLPSPRTIFMKEVAVFGVFLSKLGLFLGCFSPGWRVPRLSRTSAVSTSIVGVF